MRARQAGRRPNQRWHDFDALKALPAPLTAAPAPSPHQFGVQVLAPYPLEDLVDYIDWTPFFMTWELAGKFPAILTDEVVGEAATQLFADAKAMLKRIVEERWVEARAIFGFWPAARSGRDDVTLYGDEDRREELATLHFLRQQTIKPDGSANLSLADYVAPRGIGLAALP